VYPALTTVGALRARLAETGRALEVLWVGSTTPDCLEGKVAKEAGIAFASVATGKIRRARNPLKMVSRANVKDMLRVPQGIVQARKIINEFAPDVVLATGGYVAVPVGVATGLCGRQLVIHEQTVRLGLANRQLAGRATRVAVSSESTVPLLPGSVRERTTVTGNPVRPEVLAGQAERAVQALGLAGRFDPQRPTVYVTGGAQGAEQINTLVADILPWLLERANVVHQCGPRHVEALRARTVGLHPDAAARYLLTGYVGTELPDVLALADVVISRSGAGTLAELTALGKAAVFVPLATSAGNEQRHNANQLHAAGAAVALPDEPTPQTLMEAVGPLLAEPARRLTVAERARSHGRRDAADRLVDVLLDAAAAR
jgi:UDP-N-acetylglucosamine--N-acetylmuramyl-(pentapeptide) pyrophosphoryl-undecaprenol N-acetylglucosamine transferase